MRQWTVGGALLEGPGGLLLVRNRRRNGSHDWSPPGGVIDEGETLIEGLTREVEEETGLRVTRWGDGPVYEIDAVAEGLGWRLRVEAHIAVDYCGDLRLADPDGIVVDARFVSHADCAGHLEAAQQWVREPLGEWLRLRFEGPRRFGYHILGTDAQALEITRL
jgi:8-oxo-dGTP diphosphatase